ncbi:carboxylesterase/lipase family protein [Paenibacillus sp. MMS20-IR301]|uniref:carboxylesterase/lipase family protein n=1 Tax=Paenibacillus sp. MMS20-IR301 TaxID=2895946 RepID=UPI0028EE5536|nr:carboxylesterase/lipase family protein [Paenibacillus sp. MMS20-IR301]WNS44425.1 carboxylesterase/lipase family protein [Paenibacillus sp. MMS20-IR301]
MTGQLVNTAYGQVQGEQSGGVKVWRGIPFAAPPVGELRFCAPQPPESWSTVREAKAFGPVSLQPVSTSGTRFGGQSPVYSEDCLYLNIWSPAAEEDAGLPVMVWIHGGTFVTGAGSQPMFDGTEMARNGNVVLVTINYRLGPLGFLHLSPLGSGLGSNLGLLDQIAALEWVQGNIAAFGGDPQQVTVFGESAGSMSIAALLAMPAAKGLFSQAILESGAAQSLSGQQGEEIAAAFMAELGVQAGGSLELLHSLPAQRIMEAAGRMAYKLSGDSMSMYFQPVIEPSTLPQEPAQAIREGAASGIPLLIGTNLHEGNLFFREGQGGDSFESSLHSLELLMGIEDLSELTSDYSRTWQGQAEVLTDLFFWASSISLAEKQFKHAPVWMYRFDWTVPGHPLLEKAIHGAEILYVFGNLPLLKQYGLEVTAEMTGVAKAMQRAWTAFARHGDPAVPELAWPQYTPEQRATLLFDRISSVVNDPDSAKRERIFAHYAG